MLKKGNKEIIVLLFIIVLYACKENKPVTQENKPVTKDVLLNRTIYTSEDSIALEYESKFDLSHKILLYGSIAVDSIVMEYTNIDSVTQFVNRIFYSKVLKKTQTVKYKLINNRTKAYIEYPDDRIRSIYLDTETFDAVRRTFEDLTQDTIPAPPTFYLGGTLQYINCQKDSTKGITYYVFKGNDIAFSQNMDGYFYFDSIFHLKKIYNKDSLLYSVN